MFGIINYEVFFTSCVILSLIPGSDTIYILTQSISNDRKTGLFSAFGICSGIIVHTTLVTLGLSAILKSSPTAFQIVKFLGAGYLIYLGVKSILSKDCLLVQEGCDSKSSLKKAYIQGMITNVLNPKVALFFLAFLPQFIDTESNYYGAFAFVLLGLTYFVTTTIWSVILSFFASGAAIFLRKKQGFSKIVNKLCGSIFILLGLNLLLAKL